MYKFYYPNNTEAGYKNNNEYIHYVLKSKEVSLDYPKNWSIQDLSVNESEDENFDTQVKIENYPPDYPGRPYDAPADYLRIEINKSKIANPKNLTIDELIAENFNAFSGYQEALFKLENTQVAGYAAAHTLRGGISSYEKNPNHIIYFQKGSYVYAITYWAVNENLTDITRKIIASLKF